MTNLTKTAQIEMGGRRYRVSYDFAKDDQSLCVACTVLHIKKDGSLGRPLSGGNAIFAALQIAKQAWTQPENGNPGPKRHSDDR